MKTKLLLPDKAGYTQGTLLERAVFFPEVPSMPFRVRCVQTVDELTEFVLKLERQSWFSVDTETTHKNPRQAHLIGLSFCWDVDEAWYVPVACPRGDHCLSCEYVLENLWHSLENPVVKKIGQNLKYDIQVLKNYGINLNGIGFDTLLASYLVDAGSRRHNLDVLAKEYLNHDTIKLSSLIGTRQHQLTTKDVPLELMAAYAAEDAWVVAKIAPILQKELERQNLTKLYEHVELPLINVLADMEYSGILINKEKANELQARFECTMAGLLDNIRSETSDHFNPNSAQQLRIELFGRRGLSPTKGTPRGEYSTDAGVLAELGKQHAFPKTIAAYRQIEKLNGTYVSAIPKMICAATGRIHASFNQAVAATGRLSSSGPNLQNIPSRTEDGKQIRKMFVAPEGYVLAAFDYSQIELRVLAHYAQDHNMLEAFRNDADIHAATAAKVANVQVDDITDQMRKAAKTINFGIIYGEGAAKLAGQLGISKIQAQKFIVAYFKAYPTIKSFRQQVIAQCRRRGYVETILGRRRYLPDVNLPNGPARWTAERQAFNTVIQGSAADIIKAAMLDSARDRQVRGSDSKLLLQVHDELIFEVPKASQDTECVRFCHNMENAATLAVPLKVDIKLGPSWGDMVAYEPVTDNGQMR